jgi:hypothetical protein
MTHDAVELVRPTPIPLPGDHLNRYWLELSGANTSLVDQFRPALVTFLAFDKDKSVSPQTTVGTGFICGASPVQGIALVITAKHVLDGIHGIQTPRPLYAPSAYFVPSSSQQPTLDSAKLKIAWMDSTRAVMMNAIAASYNESTDLACCVIAAQEGEKVFRPPCIPLDTTIPSVGEIVHMVSVDEMNAAELESPKGRSGAGQALQLSRRISIRRGTVTGVYLRGYGQFRWPCFTTTIPTTGGMSGGFVYIPRDGETIAACGIVCADLNPYQSKTDQTQCGYSVIGCSWPALALRLPESLPASTNATTKSLLELAKMGHVPAPIGGVAGIELETLENGDFRLYRLSSL